MVKSLFAERNFNRRFWANLNQRSDKRRTNRTSSVFPLGVPSREVQMPDSGRPQDRCLGDPSHKTCGGFVPILYPPRQSSPSPRRVMHSPHAGTWIHGARWTPRTAPTGADQPTLPGGGQAGPVLAPSNRAAGEESTRHARGFLIRLSSNPNAHHVGPPGYPIRNDHISFSGYSGSPVIETLPIRGRRFRYVARKAVICA